MSELSQAHRDFIDHALSRRSAGCSVTLTFAQSLDGKISMPGQQLGISSPLSMTMTHVLRSRHQAILVGIGTVYCDNPSLTVRLADGPNPQPVILDSQLRFPLTCKLLNQDKKPWIIAGPDSSPLKQQQLEQRGARIIRVNDPRNLSLVIETLEKEGIESVMVEGGARIIQSFLREHELVDNLIIAVSPRVVGPRGVTPWERSYNIETRQVCDFGGDPVMSLSLLYFVL